MGSALLWFLAVVFTAGLLTLGGVFLLAGIGWALISGGVLLFSFAWFLRLGLTAHG